MKKSYKALIILAAAVVTFIVGSSIVLSVMFPKNGQTKIDKSLEGKVVTHKLTTKNVTKINIKGSNYGNLVFNIVADGKYCVACRGEYDKSFYISTKGNTLEIELEPSFRDYLDTDVTIHVGNELQEITNTGNGIIVLLDMNLSDLKVTTESDRMDLQRSSIKNMEIACDINSWQTLTVSGEETMVDKLTIASGSDVVIDNQKQWIGSAVFNRYNDNNYIVRFIGYRPETTVNPNGKRIGVYFSNKTILPATEQIITADDLNRSAAKDEVIVEVVETDTVPVATSV